MVEAWVVAFLVTLCIEGAFYLCVPATRWRMISKRTKIRDCIFIHCVTHPMVFFVFAWCFGDSTLTYVISAEVFAISVEAWWLAHRGYSYSLGISIIANLTSWVIGGPFAKALWTLFHGSGVWVVN